VPLQGSKVVASSNLIETDPRVAPLHSRLVIVDDEAVVDALLAQPMLEADISRLKGIYGATEYVSFNEMKIRLEIKKRVETDAAP